MALAGSLAAAGLVLTTVGLLAGGSGPAAPETPGFVRGVRPSFSADFAGPQLDAGRWNSFITSAAASGLPWNSDGHGGSAPANAGNLVDLEYDLPSQVHVDRGLTIVAEHTPTKGRLGGRPTTYPWRSGVVSTYGKFSFEGGYLQVEARMPTAPGMWPGVFLLPATGRPGVSDRNEIDLFEGGYLGKGDPQGNFAWRVHSASGSKGGVTDVGTDLSKGFHTYGIDWVPGKSVTWYFDGREVGQVTSAQISIPDEPMEVIVDLQVANRAAGSFHSVTSPATPDKVTMDVRRIAVYPR